MKRLYKVNALLLTGGYYGGNFIVANNKDEAIEKCRKRYKNFIISGYEAISLGQLTGEIIL